ncbi:uncharacterized protein LOC141695685 [Apium graveolens]|uniref:uncharacterized protein LOC141695685 n=1 Tax=Apium graveolens TaxID=4045 RepID=UPI003D78D1C1
MVLKFLTRNGVGEAKGDQKMVHSCYVAALRPDGTRGKVLRIEDMDVRENEELRGKPTEDLVPIPLDSLDSEKATYVGASLYKPLKGQLTTFLQKNNDVFTWMEADMPGIDPNLITHKLNLDPTRKVVMQKKRTYIPNRLEAIKREVEKLLKARFIEEVQLLEWLANPVMVKKVSGKLRMCIDFADLNDACPKDCYPLTRINTLIDATAGHEMLNFMDGFSGYNHIKMHKYGTSKVKNFEWTTESQVAFKQLKKYMIEAPLLAKPSPEDTLYLYLTVSEQAMSAVMKKEERKLQKPVYYVNKELRGSELNYFTIKKFALALITASRKLRPYFQAHKIEFLTNQPLRSILYNPKASGRLIKWAIELGEFDINGAGIVLQSPNGFIIEYALKLDFPTTNNEAEYEAFIVGLGLARAMRAKNLKVYGDSRLVVAQVSGEFKAKDDTMAKYLIVVKGILTQFDKWYAEHVSREDNTTGDALSQFASSGIENYLRSICFQVFKTPTIYVINLITLVGVASYWIDPIKIHLETGWLPDDSQEAHKLSSFTSPRLHTHKKKGRRRVDNRIILNGLKKRVERLRNTWADELLPILWAYHTTCKVTTEDTPFMLAYGAKVVVPLEITHESPRVEAYELVTNEEGMMLAIDLIDVVRDEANAHNTEHQ